MTTTRMIPLVAAAALAVGATAFAATNGLKHSDSRSSVTPPVHQPSKPPTPAKATVVSRITGTSIQVRLPGKNGKLVTVKFTAATKFFSHGKLISLSSIKPGHRIVVKWRKTKTGFVVVRITDVTPLRKVKA